MNEKTKGTGKKIISKRLLSIPILLIYFWALYEKCYVRGSSAHIVFARAEILTLLCVFALLHCFLELHVLYDTVFRYRVLITVLLIAFSVANNFNGSSMGCWSEIIQPNMEKDPTASPVFGLPKQIRSDEWAVNVPRLLSGSYTDYGEYNDIPRAAKTENISASGLYRDYSALAFPCNWGFYFLDFAHGLSFYWSYLFFAGLLFSFELFYILTQSRAFGLIGGVTLWFSSFNVWWSFSRPLLAFAAIPVLFYYTLRAEKKPGRVLYAFLLALAGADYVCNFYPAWQVPAGYVMLFLLFFFLYRYRNWKKYDVLDWGILAAALVFMFSVILRYIQADMSYIQAVGTTVYPGKRVDAGSLGIQKLLGYGAFLFAWLKPDATLPPNTSETGTFALVFPLGYILYIYILIRSSRRRKGDEDFRRAASRIRRLYLFLLPPLALLTFYTTTGLPMPLAKVFLMTYSYAERAVDFLGALLLIISITGLCFIRNEGGLSLGRSLLIAVASAIPGGIYLSVCLEGADAGWVAPLSALLSAAILFALLWDYSYAAFRWAALVTAACLAAGPLTVNPIMIGTAAVTGQPVSYAIQHIVETDPKAIWISTFLKVCGGDFPVANGARTLNSVNYLPNMDFWRKLDPEDRNEALYNRYTHVVLNFLWDGEPEFDLRAADYLYVYIPIGMLHDLDVSYVFSSVDWTPFVDAGYLTEVYAEDGVYIYSVN